MITLSPTGVHSPRIYVDQLPGIQDGMEYTAALRKKDTRRGAREYAQTYFLIYAIFYGNCFAIIFQTVDDPLAADPANGIVFAEAGEYYELSIYNCPGFQPDVTGPVYEEKIYFNNR